MAFIQTELRPFQTPNFALPVQKPGLRQDGIKFSPGIPLEDLSAQTLKEMCEEFTTEVFRKAGKERP